MTCYVALNDRYVRYLEIRVPNPPPVEASQQDFRFRGREQERFEVLQIGDGITYDEAKVRFPDGNTAWLRLKDMQVVQGDLRRVPKALKFHPGRTSLMARISRGIRSGKTFRGR